MSWQRKMMRKLNTNWLVSSKIIWGTWQIFIRPVENIKNLHFHGLLLTIAYNVWAKKSIGEFCFTTLIIDAKSGGNLTFPFNNGMRNFEIFYHLKIGTLMGFFCLKLRIHQLKIYRGIKCRDNEEWCETEEEFLVGSKLPWGTW